VRHLEHEPGQAQATSSLPMAGVTTCFVLSGVAALIYETAWLRSFSLVFGTSELAVAAVLAAYMAGLALGSAVSARVVDRVRRPILVYGVLEAGVALSALAVPALLGLAASTYAWAFGGQSSLPDASGHAQPLFYLIVTFVVLSIPTGLMGATLPLLLRHAVRSDRQLGERVAFLYAANTAGAVGGTVLAAFVLVPRLGLGATLSVGAALNGLVFAIAAVLARRAPPVEVHRETAARASLEPPIGFFRSCVAPLLATTGNVRERLGAAFRSQSGWILPLMFVSGANAFFYEVLWTRMLGHVVGGSLYAFATMLAAFLSGIAIGSWLAGHFADRRAEAAFAFAASQIGVGLLSMSIYAWMGESLPGSRAQAALVVYAVAVMLPAAVGLGATFPLAVRILARDGAEAATAGARIYAWNTVGSIFGALLAGFVLVPSLGFEGSIRLAVSINLALALWTLACVATQRRVLVGASAGLLLIVAGLYHPARPQALISSTAFALRPLADPLERFFAVGRSSTVMLLEDDGAFYLRTNGLPEATVARRGSPPTPNPLKWLTALPLVARPDAETMLVIGFGGGVALERIPPGVESIDVVEIEPQVIDANRTLQDVRQPDPLADPRVDVVFNDARNALRLTDATWDLIVSQPSHPWTAGASHLFVHEFVRDARAHLNAGGVLVQWIGGEFVTDRVAATLLAEFGHVRLYHPGARTLVFLASDAPLDLELELVRTGIPLATQRAYFARLGVHSVEDLLAALAMDRAGVAAFAAGAPLSTDDHNRMATRSRSRADGLTLAALIDLYAPYDPLLDPDSWIHAQLGGQLAHGYLAARLARQGKRSRLSRLADGVADPSTRALLSGIARLAEGDLAAARQAWRSGLAANPGDGSLRYVSIRDQLHRLGRRDGAADLLAIADGLPGSARAVFDGWRHFSRHDWEGLAGLDAQLAESRVTDAWFPEVARLRAEWRVRVAQDRERLAGEALRLIDDALTIAPERDLYLLRALCGIVLQDVAVLAESARWFAADVEGELGRAADGGPARSPEERVRMRENLIALRAQLEGPIGAGHERARVVSQRLQSAIVLLEGGELGD
jgi:spermidine synthase